MTERREAIEAAYKTYLQTIGDACSFCASYEQDAEQILRHTEYFLIFKNIFPYDTFDTLHVDEHLMIIPKRHLLTFSEFTDEESREFMKLATEYEEQGFSLYSRSSINATRSVRHHHAHLITLETL